MAEGGEYGRADRRGFGRLAEEAGAPPSATGGAPETPARRTEADVVLLETVLSRVKFVRELTMTRMDLCKLTGYASYGAGETLFRQGDAGESSTSCCRGAWTFSSGTRADGSTWWRRSSTETRSGSSR